MISPERLAALEFQAFHNGFPKPFHEMLVKTSRPTNLPNSTMIMVTLAELREFLAYYPKENNDGQKRTVGSDRRFELGGEESTPSPDHGAVRQGSEAGQAVQAQPEATSGAEGTQP